MPKDTNIQVKHVDDKTSILEFDGDIDIYNTPVLKNILNQLVDEENRLHIICNLAKVNYIDSSGIGALISGLTKVKKKGGSLKLVYAFDSVRRVLELTKMTSFFEIYDTEEEALEHC